MTKDEALKLALEALEEPKEHIAKHRRLEAITAIKEALAQPEYQSTADKSKLEKVPAKGTLLAQTEHEFVLGECVKCGASIERQEPVPASDTSEKRVDETAKQRHEQEPVAWVNWCAATGKRSVSFECESELASQPLYAGITQNTQYHYSKFHSWFDSELHRQKYTQDHPAYLAAQEAWNAANDAAQHRINRLNAEIEAWKVRFKIAEDALAKLNGPEQKPVATMWQHGETGRTRITIPGDITDCDARWFKAADLYTTPPQRKPLLASDIVTMYDENPRSDSEMIEFARAIEAAHGIKGEA